LAGGSFALPPPSGYPGVLFLYFVLFGAPAKMATPPFISQKPAKQRGKDTEYSFLREFAASSEFSSLPGGGGRPGRDRNEVPVSVSGAGGALRIRHKG
jgi:hypothetical protein